MSDTGVWVPMAEAIRLTGRSERTLRRWVAENRIPTRRRGDRVHLDVSQHVVAAPVTDAIRCEHDPRDLELAMLRQRLELLEQERDYLRSVVAGVVTSRPALPPGNGNTRPWYAFWKS